MMGMLSPATAAAAAHQQGTVAGVHPLPLRQQAPSALCSCDCLLLIGAGCAPSGGRGCGVASTGHWGTAPAPAQQCWFNRPEPPVSRTHMQRLIWVCAPDVQLLPRARGTANPAAGSKLGPAGLVGVAGAGAAAAGGEVALQAAAGAAITSGGQQQQAAGEAGSGLVTTHEQQTGSLSCGGASGAVADAGAEAGSAAGGASAAEQGTELGGPRVAVGAGAGAGADASSGVQLLVDLAAASTASGKAAVLSSS
jgi:hypothetical protein